jgi:hypothetical protein
VIGRLADGSTVRVIRLAFVPVRVAVTPGWGFIVVHGCEYTGGNRRWVVTVFNVNGAIIRTAICPGPIEAWDAWTCERGFEFMVVAVEKGKLFAFEVFFVEFAAPVSRCRTDIVALEFSKRLNVIVAVAENGSMHLVPFVTRAVEKFRA